MERKVEDEFSWLFGLRSYFMFVNDTDKLRIVKNLIALKYGKAEDMHHIIRRVCLEDVEFYTNDYQIENRAMRYEIYFDLLNKQASRWSVDGILSLMKLLFKDKMIDSLSEIVRIYSLDTSVKDAFSKGQVTSKVWLAETLQKVINPNNRLDNIVLIGGWYGHITKYLEGRVDYRKLYNIDPHEFNSFIGKKYFNNMSDRYVASSVLIEDVDYIPNQGYNIPQGEYDENNAYKFNINKNIIVNPDLIINTSAEHMSDNWFNRISVDKMVAIQTNNLFDIAPDHYNCIDSQSQLETKYPMSKVLFQGELDIGIGKRFMRIGIK